MKAIKENSKELEVVLEPIIFFDLFNCPLNPFELRKYLDMKLSYEDIVASLDSLVERKILQEKQGFYFLKGRADIVKERHRRYNYSRAKLKKASLFAKVFSFFPGVKVVAAANFIGDHNWRYESDIDLFIITKKNYLWLSRLYCAGIAKLSFSRPRRNHKRDKICLSFYISEDSLNLDELHLKGGDPYFKYWLPGLVPLYKKGSTWEKFVKANSSRADDSFSPVKNRVNYLLLNLEKLAKKVQLCIMPKYLKQAAEKKEGVLISDGVLKLYLKEKRPHYRQKYNLKKYEIFEKIN